MNGTDNAGSRIHPQPFKIAYPPRRCEIELVPGSDIKHRLLAPSALWIIRPNSAMSALCQGRIRSIGLHWFADQGNGLLNGKAIKRARMAYVWANPGSKLSALMRSLLSVGNFIDNLCVPTIMSLIPLWEFRSSGSPQVVWHELKSFLKTGPASIVETICP